MNAIEQRVAYYVERLQGDASEDAFHGLIECPPQAIPAIIDSYDSADCADTKATIIEVLGHFRNSQAIDLLKKTLADSDPKIWKPSLDSLVSIGEEALEALKNSLRNECSNVKMEYIAEAIEQIQLAPKTGKG